MEVTLRRRQSPTTYESSTSSSWPILKWSQKKRTFFLRVVTSLDGFEEGWFLEASPHRKSSILTTKQENIVKLKHLHSFVGLYKILHMATPATSQILVPLEEEVASKDSTNRVNWTDTLAQRFREAKAHIKNTQTLYLPHPDDQLVIKRRSPELSRNRTHGIRDKG